MEQVNPEVRVQLKQKLLNLLKAAPAAGIVLASATLSIPAADASLTRVQPRLSIEERVTNVRNQSPQQVLPGTAPLGTARPGTGHDSAETLLAWGNWHNWHNGWHNGWHNWHNWHNW
jgi:hypothetical protein